MVRALADAGADPNALGGYVDMTPLHWAAVEANPAVVVALLEAGADPALRDKRGRTPEEWAVSQGLATPEIIELFRAAAAARPAARAASLVDCPGGWSAEDLELRLPFYRDLTPEMVAACLPAPASSRTKSLRRSNMSARPRVRTVWLLTRPAGRIVPFPCPAPSRCVCRAWASLRSQPSCARLLRIRGRAAAASRSVFLSRG